MLTSLWLSIKVASIATILVFVVGIVIATILGTKKFRGKELIEIICTLPLVLPPTVTGYYLILLFGRNGIVGAPIYQATGFSIMFTWYAAVLASFVVAIPLMIRTSQAAIESIDQEMIDSARMLGYSEFEIAYKVIIPLAKKGIIAGVILSFARALGEFGATLMVAGNIPGKTDTMPLAIYGLTSSGEWSRAHFMVIILTFVSGFFLFISGRFTRRKFR